MNSKLHAVCDEHGRPLILLLSEGKLSDYKGAALMIDAFPKAKVLLGDRGYVADWFRHTLIERGITPCIPSKSNRKIQILRDKTLYRQRQSREHVRQNQGLATHTHPLQPMRPHVHVRHLHRRNRHLLAQSMSPDPRGHR